MIDADSPSQPSVWRWVLAFIIVGIAWGFTTPFIRRAAVTHAPPPHPILESPSVQRSWIKSKLYSTFFAVIDLLRNPRYAIPLVINLTGSIWFFLIIGQAGMSTLFQLSLTVPIVNSLAFLFTVLGEWYVEKKVIDRDTWIGMTLSLCGIALCVHSKS